jgi:hypothetical protein
MSIFWLVSKSCHVKTKFVCIVTLYQFIMNKYVYTTPVADNVSKQVRHELMIHPSLTM